MLYRAQRATEKLAEYVADMELTEFWRHKQARTKVLKTIFCRLNSRNNLAGLSVMRSTEDLMRALTVVESILELANSNGDVQTTISRRPVP